MENDSSESVSSTFEWTIRNLKQIFDSSRGDGKSRVIKSPRFGGGRWQILFYANAGTLKESTSTTDGGGFISLFLACEPTAEEKEVALGDSGKWVREGVYRFSFELRNVEKNVLHNLKEAANHTFSYKTANWGWAQFARRDVVYYQSVHAKAQDAFVIVCTITSSPTPVTLPPSTPRLSVPKPLLDTVGSLLDDPRYSDVEFLILRRPHDHRKARRIWASRKMLQRAEHFDAMLGTSFAEGNMEHNPLHTPRVPTRSLTISATQSDAGGYSDDYIDSDDEDDDLSANDDGDEISSSMYSSDNDFVHAVGAQDDDDLDNVSFHLAEDETQHNDRPTLELQTDTTPTAPTPAIPPTPHEEIANEVHQQHASKPHMTVIIRDVAYNTYRALLYYLYTDNVVFAPLSSSFTSSRLRSSVTSTISSAPSEATLLPPPKRSNAVYTEAAGSRKEWIKEWMKNNPGRPAPCSAKAIYREADRLDLKELKARAAQHIFKSLTVENIAYEVFSPFASTFDEIRKVEINFFLKHWQDIRTSEAMKNVWQQIRNGRHPGFEEVWPTIAMNLEFKPAEPSPVTQSARGEPAQQVSV